MVAFRKVLPVLALVVLMAAVASAQATFQCNANTGQPSMVRAEGLAEPVGDLALNCSGGTAGTVLYVNVQIFLTTNVTSNILNKDTGASEALLMFDDPAPAAQCLGSASVPGGKLADGTACATANMFLGERVVQENSILWRGVPIVAPGTGTRVVRVTNIRANATMVPSGTFVPGYISEYISITGATSVPVANQPQTVGFVQPSLAVTTKAASARQCTGKTADAKITFTELFPSAFRKMIETDAAGAPVEQDLLNQNYVTESMFTNAALFGNSAGKANQGTRFIVTVKNVQNGVKISVPAYAQSGTLYAVRVPNADATGAGGTAPLPAAATAADLSLSGGVGYAVYEVVGTGPGINGLSETQAFTITVTSSWEPNIGSNIPGLGTSQISGAYGPINTTAIQSATAPEPRFKDTTVSGDLMTVSACRTILLFPFITNQVGFDTGIVIANTSSDPMSNNSNRQQQGACTLNYYGTTTGGGAAPAAQTSQVVPTGTQLVFTLSGGGNLGIAATPGFQGYLIATARFQYCHAFAFISDLGANRLAEGYLGIILDAPGLNRTGQTGENYAH